jgi:hypothetical protein
LRGLQFEPRHKPPCMGQEAWSAGGDQGSTSPASQPRTRCRKESQGTSCLAQWFSFSPASQLPEWMSFFFDFVVLLSCILTVTLKEEVAFSLYRWDRKDISAHNNKMYLPVPLLSEKWTPFSGGHGHPPHLCPSSPFWTSCSTTTLGNLLSGFLIYSMLRVLVEEVFQVSWDHQSCVPQEEGVKGAQRCQQLTILLAMFRMRLWIESLGL